MKFLNQEADITDMVGFCSIWFVCLFVYLFLIEAFSSVECQLVY